MKRPSSLPDYCMIVLAAVLGTGSIILFATSGKLITVRMGWPESTALLWDGALSLTFFIQHSGMVRSKFRARLAEVLPDRYQGAFYSIASGIVLTFVALFWQPTQTHLLILDGVPLWIARGCAGLALATCVWGALALHSFDLLGVAPIRAHLQGRPSSSTPFVIRGPYRWVRHPLYSSVLVLFWSAPDLTTDRLLLNVLWTGWIIAGTLLEERDLTARFGETYREYQRKVPMLVPWRGALATGG